MNGIGATVRHVQSLRSVGDERDGRSEKNATNVKATLRVTAEHAKSAIWTSSTNWMSLVFTDKDVSVLHDLGYHLN